MKKTSAVKTTTTTQTKKLIRGRYTPEFKQQSLARCATKGVAVTARDLGTQLMQQFRAKHLGQCKGIEQIFAFKLAPLFSLGINAAAGDNNMHMRMQEPSVMRVQHRALAEFGFKVSRAKAFDRVRCGAE